MAYTKNLKKYQGFGQLMGALTVPPGVNSLYLSGCAAGAAGVITPNNWANAANSSFGVSASGDYIICTNVQTAAQNHPMRMDPLGLKAACWATSQTLFGADTAGRKTFVADNGFGLTMGATSGTAAAWYATRDALDWATTSLSMAQGENNIALNVASITRDSPLSAIRAVLTLSNGYAVWGGSSWTATNSLGTGFQACGYLRDQNGNGFFYIGDGNTAGNTKIQWQTEALANSNSGWNSVTLDGSVLNRVNEIIFVGGTVNLFVAFCNGGKIYTAPTLGGAWTARASGTTNNLVGGKWNGTRIVALENTGGNIVHSTDGVTWTRVTGAIGTIAPRNSDAIWSYTVPGTGGATMWVAHSNASTFTRLYTSSDGITWTISPNTTTYSAIVPTFYGLVGLQSTATAWDLIVNPTLATTLTMDQTSTQGGDFVVQRSGGTRYTLKGGRGLNGGNSLFTSDVLSSSATGGRGLGGQSVLMPTTGGTTATGNAGLGNTTVAGGGAGIPFPQLLKNDGLWGIKIPGGGSGAATAGGGASSFGAGGNYTSAAVGPGSGAAGGGAGESVVRYEFPVTPGEVIYFTGGLASRASTAQADFASPGCIQFEVEA
jgi:hypothetical protein